MIRGKNQHIFPRGKGKWAIKSSGHRRAAKVVDSLEEATNIAVERAMKERANVILHGADQAIRYSRLL